MSVITSGEVWSFIIAHLGDAFKENGTAPDQVDDDFDLLKMGVIDSIGFISLISAVEDRFGVEIDFEDMDTDNLTVIGPMSRYIEERALRKMV
jgi:acyl carrier protein